ALDKDDTQVEARVRLARLLEIRDQYKEAARQLDLALAADALASDRTLSYFAHLFAARAQRGIGQLDAAAAQLRTARQMFPQAQSAMIAESALALQRGAADEAKGLLRQLTDLPRDPSGRLDPWLQYDLGPGRNADAVLQRLWIHAGALGR